MLLKLLLVALGMNRLNCVTCKPDSIRMPMPGAHPSQFALNQLKLNFHQENSVATEDKIIPTTGRDMNLVEIMCHQL